MPGKTLQRMLAAGAILILVAGAALWWWARPEPFAIHVRFKEAQGLRRGQKVMFKGVPVGEVGAVVLTKEGDVRIDLALDQEHHDLIKEGATGYIGQSSLVSVTNEKTLELYNADETAKPIAAGSDLVGMNGYLELKAWQTARWGESVSGGMSKRAAEWYDRAAVRGREMYDSARASFQGKEADPETESFLKELKDAVDRKMADIDARLPELEARYRKAYDRIKEHGDGKVADQLQHAWEEFKKAVSGTEGK